MIARKWLIGISISLLVVHGLVKIEPADAISYMVTDLGTLGTAGGMDSVALGINNFGQVVGRSETDSGPEHAFRTAPNSPIVPGDDLGTLPGGSESEARAVNSFGRAVGSSTISTGSTVFSRAFRTAPNSPIVPGDDLGVPGGFTDSFARGINDLGQVAGFVANKTTPITQAFLFTDTGGMIILGTLGGTSSGANGISSAGLVVGSSDVSGGATHAFLFTPGLGGGMTDLGTLGGSFSEALGINDLGQVVGQANITGDAETHAFLCAGACTSGSGGMIDLGTLAGGTLSEATGINTAGQVVGLATVNADPDNPILHAFLYSSGVMQDLNDLVPLGSGITLHEARAISEGGQIAAIGSIAGGPPAVYHAFRLDPVPVPEPNALLLLVSGLAGLGGISWNRRGRK